MQQRLQFAAAVKALREAANLTQEQAAEKAGITLTAWQNYEYGKRRFTRRLKGVVTAALGISEEELEARRAVVAENDEGPEPAPSPPHRAGMQDRDARSYALPMIGRVRAGPKGVHVYDAGEPQTIDFASFFGPDWRALQLGGESMVPYAEPGGFVTYNVKRNPQRNKGCVIVTRSGEYYVKRYDGIRDGKLFVTELHPVERQIEFDMEEVEGVYPVGLRTD